MERTEALEIVKAFKETVNNGGFTTKENWDMVLGLMEKFNITTDEVK